MSLFLVLFCLIFTSITFSKVYEVYHRDHLHDYMQDLPVSARFSTVLAFYNDTSSCQNNLKQLNFNSNDFPGDQYYFMGKYELSTERERVWYNWVDHLDLPKYINLNEHINNLQSVSVDSNGQTTTVDTSSCPILVYLPISYANSLGDTYLNNPSLDGVDYWNPIEYPNWRNWVWKNLKVNFKIITQYPYDFEITLIPFGSNTLLNKNDKKPRTIKINAMESHTIIEAYVGDKFYVSANPVSIKDPSSQHIKKPTVSQNPTYTVYPDLEALYIEEDDEGKFGFNIGRRREIEGDRWVKRRHSTTMMTHTRNLVLPKIIPNTNKLGFKKIQMPPGIHERLVNYYRRFYSRRLEESWDSVGTQLNFFDIKSYMISLDHDWRERDAIANDLIKPILKDWSGEKELELTAFYGIREYERGAVLRNHVDRTDTHIYSVILQIGQTGIDVPWPLEVIGFDGNRYEITLEPGEMILYEGTKLIHGRPHYFNGTIFSNAFVHFKPPGYPWTTEKIWREKEAQETLKTMHVSLQDIYR